MTVDRRTNGILVLDDALSTEQLDLLTKTAANAQFAAQGLGSSALRARRRSVVESPTIASLLFESISAHLGKPSSWFAPGRKPNLSPPIEEWSFHACNPRSRFYDYSMGGSFAPHEDETWVPDESRRSLLTVLVYLPTDEDCIGGETVIDGEVVGVEPGRIVVFDHSLQHEDKPVERGRKLALRNDVVAGSPAAAMTELIRESERLGLYGRLISASAHCPFTDAAAAG